MRVIGLTGGIACGKSTVSARLAERGAVIVDGDRISRRLTAADGPALPEIRAAFGDGVFQADGSLEVVNRVEQKRALELDPSAGVTAEGKKRTPERKPGTRKKEPDVPAEEKPVDGAE